MRLDKYLKVSRLIKRRTVANEACDASRVLVNGKPALYFHFLLCNLYIAIIYDIYRKIKEVQPISCILWRVPWNKK